MRLMNYISLAVLSSLIIGCGQKFDLPTESYNEPPVFGAGKKSYIRISPDWDTANGYTFQKPWDIVVGSDGYVFIADHEQAAIHTISGAGIQVTQDEFGNDFTDLMSLSSADGSPIYPMAIAQDERLNLYIADSSNRVYVWDQYLNNVGVDSMVAAVQLRSSTDSLVWLSSFDSINALQAEGWEVENLIWTTENLEQWLAPRLYWDAGQSEEAIEVAKYFIKPDSIRVTGIGASNGLLRVADAHSNAILTLSSVPEALLMTGAGQEILVYRGSMSDRTVSAGTGNGTVNDPRGLTHDQDGAIYYTQWGKNFSVHKVGGSNGFEYGEHDIMEIERYDHASDVALDALGNIYVADSGHDLVQQFSPLGEFVYHIGTSKVVVDSIIVDSVLVGSSYQIVQRDTTFQVEVADNLTNPRSVAVDATGIVYIADTENNRVMRYRLSTELDYGEDK